MSGTSRGAGRRQPPQGLGGVMGLLTRSRQRQDSGFTLIELLAVIVILGILAGVVVFAVRGTGEKGRGAAMEAEARIIRTAQEAHCARYGSYAKTFAELQAKKLLGSSPGYHSMTFDENEGACGNTRYELLEEEPGYQGPGYQGPGPEEPNDCGQAKWQRDGWCIAAFPTGYYAPDPEPWTQDLVKLPDGKILGVGVGPGPAEVTAEVFDPAGDPTGQGKWTFGAKTVGPGNLRVNSMVLITGTATQCGANCGKVLVHLSAAADGWMHIDGAVTGLWRLYDPSPEVEEDKRWSVTGVPDNNSLVRATLLTGTSTQCGDNCGKVLINRGLQYELYDPSINQGVFIPIGPGTPGVQARLPDGRVLIVGVKAVGDPEADFFNPSSGTFDNAPSPPSGPYWEKVVTLLDNRVMVVGPSSAALYTPANGGDGVWLDIPECGQEGEEDGFCNLQAATSDGGVLAYDTLNGRHWIFKPGTNEWLATSMRSPVLGGTGITIGGPGIPREACAPNCGKVLVAWRTYALLYTPPA